MRTVRFLLQTDPDQGGPVKLNHNNRYKFDIELVGMVAMRELIQTCRSSSHMTSVIRSLLAGRNGQPLVWRDNGPGIGWEMRSAWSGLFGRFFARAYLEEQGFTWFHPIQRSYDPVTDNLVVTRVGGSGELADWICAKDAAAAKSGEIAIAEAKGRHREGNLALNKLPRPLRTALDQIANTFVEYRDSTGALVEKRAKGYAILTKWTNQHKGSRAGALLRVVDPETSGHDFETAELKNATSGLGRAHVAGFIKGLGMDALAYASSPAKEGFNLRDATRTLENIREIINSRRSSASESPELEWMDKATWKRHQISDEAAERLIRGVERQIEDLKKWRPDLSSTQATELLNKASDPQEIVQLKDDSFGNEKFVGQVFGMVGPISRPLSETVDHIHKLPEDLSDQFLFVGARTNNVRKAISNAAVEEWLPQDTPTANGARDQAKGIYTFRDGTIIAPVTQIEVLKRRQRLT